MATSFIEFRNFGFWCEDSLLETWLSYFLQQIDEADSTDDWLLQLKQQWQFQATAGLVGCIDLELDDFADSQEHIFVLLKLAAQTHRVLIASGGLLTAEILNNRRYKAAGVIWTESVASTYFLKVGQLFSQLLEGTLQTKVDSPLDYLEPQKWAGIHN
ncbi:hypothetical protein [Hymenobacter pini]|uniref:hypothetical protein n=1 Tax=Hymenobacter pini TaxID=2880879 RepID=UPI001CF5464C|nr:hypothetical protein [Hymenobacter pini]MCA8830059.1 hypothetical protein [Hymenobacter pini]